VEFEWDDAKAAINLSRHGVDFHDAIRAFLDPFRLELEDARYDYGESRFRMLGEVNGVLLIVIFTEHEESIRLISARVAEPNERRLYHESQTRP
jgi:uncharacterized protein